MDRSETTAEGPRSKSALWGGTPQYDYVCFEKRTRYRIPSEAGCETGGTEDDPHYLENSLSYPQVGLDKWDICGSRGLPRITQDVGALGVELWSTHVPVHSNPTSSPLRLLTPKSGIDFHSGAYIQECYQHFQSGGIFTQRELK